MESVHPYHPEMKQNSRNSFYQVNKRNHKSSLIQRRANDSYLFYGLVSSARLQNFMESQWAFSNLQKDVGVVTIL